jgi:hypothetical protein
MVKVISRQALSTLPPHSRAFRRGALGDAVDGRSSEGKFLRKIEAELIAQIGGEPSFAQSLLIRRAARSMLQLELLDEKMASGNWTSFDARTQGGLNNTVRLSLQALGVKSAPVAKSSPLAAHFAKPHRAAAL